MKSWWVFEDSTEGMFDKWSDHEIMNSLCES